MTAAPRWVSDRLDVASEPPSTRPRVLLLTDWQRDEAATVRDHVDAVRSLSRYDVFVLPIRGDLPDDVRLELFDAVVVHYSLMLALDSYLSPLTRWRLACYSGVKAVFVQDEYRMVHRTVDVLRAMQVDVLFTCVPEDQVPLVYPARVLPGLRAVTVLTGYVSPEMLSHDVPDFHDRPVEVGYRGRRSPPWLGHLGQEKAVIADRFSADAASYGLTTDLSVEESDRLYGDAWVSFIQSCRAMLGAESGASVFDFDGSLEAAVLAHQRAEPAASYVQLHRLYLEEAEGRIRLNQISPRCFEAAALGTMMVLYDGEYSGILRPWEHYVPLRKDHSNMAEVVAAVRDEARWREITTRARIEVAASSDYSFAAMVEIFDRALDLGAAGRATGRLDPREHRRRAEAMHASMPQQTRIETTRQRMVRRRNQLNDGLPILAPDPRPAMIDRSRADESMHAPRSALRRLQAAIWWRHSSARLPLSLAWRHRRSGLLAELGAVASMQALGTAAVRLTNRSPITVQLDRTAACARFVSTVGDDGRATGSPASLCVRRFEVALTEQPFTPAELTPVAMAGLPLLSTLAANDPQFAERVLRAADHWAHWPAAASADADEPRGRVAVRRADRGAADA